MSSSCDLRPRARVVREPADAPARPARLDADLDGAAALVPLLDPAHLAAVTEDARRSGHAAGFDAGLAEGRAAAVAVAAEELDELRRALADATRALGRAAAELAVTQALELRGAEEELVDAALAIAEAVVGRELAVAADPGRDALVRALRLVPPAAAAVAHLHPADLRCLEGGGVADVSLVADPAVEPGGCVVVAGDARVDAQIGPALARVAEVLGRTPASSAGPGGGAA
jgi:flagellar assembly protein FliH